jgi:hypothetical protein
MTKRRAPVRPPVSRAEFDRLTAIVEKCSEQMELQFKRTAQIQAELDHIRTAWNRVNSGRQKAQNSR